ncbi:MAG: aldo/keto reductase [Inquilinus sp.]|uniref:aldo/keto reductase n=1 Tax=Inquilinus sp. TaxID=1932117 RepID=UPI003F3F592D
MQSIAACKNTTPASVSLAWLLHRSPVMIAIPGTSSLRHLEENVGAAGVELLSGDIALLDGLARTTGEAA